MTSHERRYRVHVNLAQRDRSTLLALVSTLHRRGVDVAQAELRTSFDGEPEFVADFTATPGQASTVAASLNNRIDVLDAELESPELAAQRSLVTPSAGPILNTVVRTDQGAPCPR